MSKFHKGYRKGVILGFTMAEVMLLLLFTLLLIIYVINITQQAQLKKIQNQADHLETIVNNIGGENNINALTELLIQTKGKDNFDEFFQELILATKTMQENAHLQDEIKSLTKVKQLIEKNALTEESIPTMIEQINEYDKVKKLVTENLQMPLDTEHITSFYQQLKEILDSKKENQQEVTRLKGQMQNLKKQLAELGKGSGYPPCWADPETGSIEYIFNIDITSNGVVVHKNNYPHRYEEEKNLPLQHINLNREISSGQFSRDMHDLFNWSIQHECRFFVRTNDKTLSTEKNQYKKMMKAVGGCFYYLEK